MKVYKNQNKQNAEQNGFLANYEFAKDTIMSPEWIDVTPNYNSITKTKTYEVTKYDKEKDIVDIMVMNEKEYEKWEENQLTKNKE